MSKSWCTSFQMSVFQLAKTPKVYVQSITIEKDYTYLTYEHFKLLFKIIKLSNIHLKEKKILKTNLHSG